jgi:SP family myo-inositol transporter-like MFS transporter 13
MSLALILAAVAFHFLTLDTNGELPDNGVGLNQTFAPVVLAAMILYVACYATGIGNIPVSSNDPRGHLPRPLTSA